MGSKWNKLNDEDFLEILRKYHKENPRNIIYEVFKKHHKEWNAPSLKAYTNRFKLTWTEILLKAGIKNIREKYEISKEEGIEKLKEFAKLLDKTPSQSDFNKYKWKPSFNWYYKNFDSYEDVCIIAGLKPNNSRYIKGSNTHKHQVALSQKDINEKIEISINEIMRIADLLSRYPTNKEYDKLREKGYSASRLSIVSEMSFMEICHKYLSDKYPPRFGGNNKITSLNFKNESELIEYKEILSNELIKVCNDLGHPPNITRLTNYDLPTYNVFKKLFNNKKYNEILKELGITINKDYECEKSNEQLLDEYYNLFLELNRLPSREDLKFKELSGDFIYKKRFGTIQNVCNMLNIDYEKYNTTAGRHCLDNNGDLCRSYIERDITNFFILNNIQYIKEPSYKEFFKNDRRRFDWKIFIEDKIYYIEYFGMYKTTKGCTGNKYNKRVEKKIEDLNKINITDKCIFIYWKDIYSNSLKEIFQPYFNNELTNMEYQPHKKITRYSDLSDTELIEIVFKDRINKNNFPKVKELTLTKYSVYSEIIQRYGCIYDFAVKYGFTNINKPRNYKDISKR